VRVDLDVLIDVRPGETLTVHLFDDVALDIVLEQKETTGSGGVSWSGRVVAVEGSQVTLVIGGGQLAGNIVLPKAHYRIRHLREEVHVIHEIDPAAFPDEDEPPSS
jgi:hypothetical protein